MMRASVMTRLLPSVSLDVDSAAHLHPVALGGFMAQNGKNGGILEDFLLAVAT